MGIPLSYMGLGYGSCKVKYCILQSNDNVFATWRDKILKRLRYGGPFMAWFVRAWGVAKQGINLLFNQKRKLGLQSIKRLKIDRIVAENSIMVSISPFKILLNNLNGELDQRNLESLVHVCWELIPGGQRERITSGWEVFSVLLRQNAIGEEPRKMAFLLRIIKELRPKRRDLVGMVKRYIEEHYEQPEEILTDFESSSDGYIVIPRSPTPTSFHDCCSVRCWCFNCSCTPCCSGFCYFVIIAVFFIFLAIAAALLWYVFPRFCKLFNSNDDLRVAGPVIIAGLLALAACCISFGIYIKRRNRQLNYSELRSDIDSRSVDAPSDSVRTGYVRKKDRRGSNACSCNSGRITDITASSSFNSLWSARTPWPRTDAVVVTDGCNRQDNEFSQEIEVEEEDNDDELRWVPVKSQ